MPSARTSESASSVAVMQLVDAAARAPVHARRADEAREEPEGPAAGLERRAAPDLHLLRVVHAVNGVLRSTDRRRRPPRGERAEEPEVLDGHGVPLLRHDRAHLHVSVRDVEMSHLEPCPRIEILREPPEVDEEELERPVHAGEVVVGGDAAVGILLHPLEPEELCHRRAVERKT
jgi:hypothetical protein